MQSKLTPQQDLYVIWTKQGQSQDARGRVEALGEITALAADGLLLRVDSSSHPLQIWRSIQGRLGDLGIAEPVLVDDCGIRHYPTGEISVRFACPPSDAEMARFAQAHGLAVRSRNKYVAEQVVFRPIDSTIYLPDVIESIRQTSNIVAVWANTKSFYWREQPAG